MLQRLFLFTLEVTCLCLAWGYSSPYCRFTQNHTLCLHKGLGPNCGSHVPSRGVDAQDVSLILARHNQRRSQVALGKESRGSPGPQPQASNMMLMEWDNELARIAQSHSDQCVFKLDCLECRRVERYHVGQNLFMSHQIGYNQAIHWERVIEDWYNTVALFNSSVIQRFQVLTTSKSHQYTQMIWWRSFKIGCGFTMFIERGWWKKLYTCNYGPAGNIQDGEMYLQGPPCSSCPVGTVCSLKYQGLCGFVSSSSAIWLEALKSPTTGGHPSIAYDQEAKPQPKDKSTEVSNLSEDELTTTTDKSERPEQLDGKSLRKRVRPNTQIITTPSLSVVWNIIKDMPAELEVIIFFRSPTGELTEQNVPKIFPQREVYKDPEEVYACSLILKPCETKAIGSNWTEFEAGDNRRHLQAYLDVGEGAQLLYKEPITPPSTEVICIYITHRRELQQISTFDAPLPELTLGLIPSGGGKMLKYDMLGGPGVWEQSEISVHNVTSPFIVGVTISPVSSSASVAIDILYITDVPCCTGLGC